MQTAEESLIREAQSGSAAAFEQLLSQYYSLLFKAAYKWCGHKEDAEEIAQEACIKIGRNLHTFRHESAFSSWVYRIVVNLSKDKLRQKKPKEPLDEQTLIAEKTKGPDEDIYNSQVWRAVQQLPEKQRDAVLLVYGEGLTHAEAANILEAAEGTISWYITEAKKSLGRRMQA